jgi:4'-phosphopantetheinyl transferase
MIPSNEIHLYYQPFEPLYKETDKYLSLLSEDEQQRAKQFHFEMDQKNFIIARGSLRTVLASYLQSNPKTILFNYGAHGKPYLIDSSLEFNLTHSKEAFLIGCTVDTPIGVDLELISRKIDYCALGEQIFSPAEKIYFESLATDNKAQAFFQIWTRKEAFIKAIGRGLSMDLKSITTTSQEAPLLLEHAEQNWRITDLPHRNNHCLALAVQSDMKKSTVQNLSFF